MKGLDDRLLGGGNSEARAAWGRRYGWSLFILLGAVLLAICAWAVAVDRPAVAGMNVGLGAGCVSLGVFLFAKRHRADR